MAKGACMVKGGGCAWDMMRYGDTINERVVRILLECILVPCANGSHFFCSRNEVLVVQF